MVEAFHFGLQIPFKRDRHAMFLPEAGKNRWEQETCYCALVRIRIIVFAWKNYFGERQKKQGSKITVGGKTQSQQAAIRKMC